MGNLHAGHLGLMARGREVADRVVASIFVNPLQFGPSEDFAAYPRTLETDAVRLAEAGVDLLFAPTVEVMYPQGQEALTRIEVPGLSDILCGASRPGHFSGVATVVNKLFNQVQPDAAVFGQKDWQQLMVIRRMVADLDMPVEIIGVPTRREDDGLAMSSRNGYLSEQERQQAPQLFATLQAMAARLQTGERDFAAIEAEGGASLEAAGLKPDYLSIRRATDLVLPTDGDTDLVILAAAYLGRARLIDNLPLGLMNQA
jgi:pantoate--beta-alanine ligase